MGNSIVSGIQEYQALNHQVDSLADRYGFDSSDPNVRKTLKNAAKTLNNRDSSTELRRQTTQDIFGLAGLTDDQQGVLNNLFEDSFFDRDGAAARRQQEALSSLSPQELSNLTSTSGGGLEITITSGRSEFALGSQLVDDLAVGAGEVFEFVGKNIEANPFLKYGLTTLDITAGPVAFMVRDLIAKIPAVQEAQQELFEIGRDKFLEVGDSDIRSNSGGGGVLGLGSLILGGAAGVLKAVNNFDFSFGKNREIGN